MIAYLSEGRAGYGHRLFLPTPGMFEPFSESQRAAHELLKKLCIWGGHDKRWVIEGILHFGYEFPVAKWNALKEQIEAAGINIVCFLQEAKDRETAGRPPLKIESHW